MVIGNNRSKPSEFVLGVIALLLVSAFFIYQAWNEGNTHQIYTPIINFIVFSAIFFFSWRVRRNNNKLETSDGNLRIRNALKIDVFKIAEIHELRRNVFFLNWLCFKYNGFSYYYPIGKLSPQEKILLDDFIERNKR